MVQMRQRCQGDDDLSTRTVPHFLGESALRGVRAALARVLEHASTVRPSALLLPLVSLVGFSAMSCIVVSDPQFEDPVRSAPVFLPDRAVPDARNIIKLDQTTTQFTFSGLFVSEDDGKELEARLYVDYGVVTLEKPYADVIIGNRIPAGSLDDGAREAVATWTSGEAPISPGCHRMTLVVAHEYGADGCPVSPTNSLPDQVDYDAITWTVLRCDADCPPIDVDDLASQCPSATRSCAKFTETATP